VIARREAGAGDCEGKLREANVDKDDLSVAVQVGANLERGGAVDDEADASTSVERCWDDSALGDN